jgi:PhoH-like ATPase
LKKTFVLDTNVLLYDSESIFSFDDNNIVIPLIVLEELDQKKNRQDEIGKNSRKSSRYLDELRDQGSLQKGVKLKSGGIIKVLSKDQIEGFDNVLLSDMDESKPDSIIIATAYSLQKNEKDPVILVTKDINVRVTCDVLGVQCEDYRKHRVVSDAETLYSGVQRIEVSQEIVDKFYTTRKLEIDDTFKDHELYPNQFLVLKDNNSGQQSIISRFKNWNQPLTPLIETKQTWGLIPRNKEQKFALDILFDDSIKLVTLVGKAGTGKTLLAISSALQQTLEPTNKLYKKVVISRPVQPVGKDIGFLPGTLEEKMDPWIAPIKDNLKFLFSNDSFTMDMYIERGEIEIEAITFIRGRSIADAIIIIDEAQNLTTHELKTIITRVGENTKIILTGDIDQIDNTYVDSVSNGLTYAIEKFKDYPIAAHITLLKGERSELATLGAKIL